MGATVDRIAAVETGLASMKGLPPAVGIRLPFRSHVLNSHAGRTVLGVRTRRVVETFADLARAGRPATVNMILLMVAASGCLVLSTVAVAAIRYFVLPG